MWNRFLLVAGLLLLGSRPVAAQGEFNNWYFGHRAGVTFNGGPARALSDGQMVSGEGCASISDAQGNLLFYTNGIYAWNRLHRRLAGGFDLGAYQDSTRTELPPNSATQGVVAVPRPGSSTEYYIFTVDAAEHGLANGLRYSVVDLSLQGGLGEVTRKAVPVPVPIADGRLTEKLIAVRHANQRDIWIMVYGWNSNVFACFLLTPAGLSAVPVLSAGGTVHQGGTNPRNDYNALGSMKVSRDGRKLAVAQYTGVLELFDFNYGTGVVSGPRLLDVPQVTPQFSTGYYGLEFSPDGNLLYASSGSNIRQYHLPTGARTVFPATAGAGALQLGPDLKIYLALYITFNRVNRIGVIEAPNIAGPGCNYRNNAVEWTDGRTSQMGLPNVLVRPPVPDDVLLNFSVLATDVCEGQTSSFAASVYPAIPDAVFSWDFGDPGDPGNTATGATATHRYRRAGTYTVTMTMREVSGAVRTYSQSVRVIALPTATIVRNPAGGVLCANDRTLLTVSPTQPAGTTYLWHNGDTTPQYQAGGSGTYWVQVTSPQGCVTRDSISLAFLPVPLVDLGPDQVVCAEPNLVLDPGPQPPGSSYRWQDGSTEPRLAVRLPGRYSVRVTSAAGCSAADEMLVAFGDDCPFIIPNIITPNGDADNETFRLKGLELGAWDIRLYNRWGVLIYEQAPYDNGWSGKGHATGNYYYLVTHRRTGQQYRGWLEVLR